MFFSKKLFNKKEDFENLIPSIVVGKKRGLSESYYRLKDNVIYSSDNGKNKVFQIESAVSGEGKSTVISNLAVALQKSGKKVVVVDLDFRRPKIHKIFEVTNLCGITEFMLGECKESDLIKTTQYGVDVVNRGKAAHNASIIFTSDKFKNMVEALKEKYDFVLFDCPPILLVSDYIHFSKLSDMVIFVACAGTTQSSHLKDAYEMLKKYNSNILGTVMTYRNLGKFSIRYGGYYHTNYYRNLKNHYMQEK